MLRYKYEVKRVKRSQEELDFYQKLYGDERDEVGELLFDLNDPDTLYHEPSVDMKCFKCNYEESVPHEILIELNFGNKGLHALACPNCSHTKKRGAMYPKFLFDLDDDPITYQDILNSYND